MLKYFCQQYNINTIANECIESIKEKKGTKLSN